VKKYREGMVKKKPLGFVEKILKFITYIAVGAILFV